MKLSEIGLADPPQPTAELAPSPTGAISGFTLATEQARDNALLAIRAIPAVDSIETQAALTKALQPAVDLLAEIEAGRKRWVAPFLTEQRRANDAAKAMSAPLLDEVTRRNAELGSFQALQRRKAESARIAAELELSELNRKRHEALAQAESHDEVDAINTDHDNQAQAVSLAEPVVAAEQKVKEDWEVTVTDIHKLYSAQPTTCSVPIPRLSVIKTLLDAGVNVPGVVAKKVVVSKLHKTRVGAIEV